MSFLFAILACLAWGLIFVVPGFLSGFSPIEVALGRYFFYGIVSVVFFILHHKSIVPLLSSKVIRKALLLAFVGNILYYFTLVISLRYSSVPVTALILGMAPISIAFYGNWRKKESSFKMLVLPSLWIAAGLVAINLPAFSACRNDVALFHYCIGLGCAFTALAAWTWFAVVNAGFLKKNPEVSASDWSAILGVATFAWVLIVGSVLLLLPNADFYVQKYSVWSDGLYRFIIGTLVLGFVCSWVGSYFWNRASVRLPVALAGQLIIFETLFGLLFVYLIESRIPTLLETLGVSSMLIGVLISMRRFRKEVLTA